MTQERIQPTTADEEPLRIDDLHSLGFVRSGTRHVSVGVMTVPHRQTGTVTLVSLRIADNDGRNVRIRLGPYRSAQLIRMLEDACRVAFGDEGSGT